MCNLCDVEKNNPSLSLLDLYPELTTQERYIRAKVVDLSLGQESYDNGYDDGYRECMEENEYESN